MSRQLLVLCAAALVQLAASKGCFIKTSNVLMADGSSKQLQNIKIGDEVTSWDEHDQKVVPSTVKATPVFQRKASEMIELTLSSDRRTIHATEDHPFWSRSKQALVSMHPNSTRKEYDLEASLLQTQDTLESHEQQHVGISSIRRSSSTSRFLSEGRSHDTLEVMTLCLSPHHWYYVEGVRVHNKGCFVPSTPVLMNDGKHKPISEVAVDEHVMSWDMENDRPVQAKVLGIEVFPASNLMEIKYNASTEGTQQSLVCTADHPIYSAGQQQLVSMEPSTTKERYGLHVGQMLTTDMFRHHLGHQVLGEVQTWQGSAPHVMTLRLDTHHWFYANGLLVHNKGGGGGGGGSSGGGSSGGFGGGTRSVTRTRAAMGAGAFMGVVWLHGGSRRRYGTYRDEPDSKCKMHPEATVTQSCQQLIYGGGAARDGACQIALAADGTGCCDCCHKCMECTDATCTANIPGCEDFYSGAFAECTEEEDEGAGIVIVVIVFFVLSVVGCAVAFCVMKHRGGGGGFGSSAELNERAQARMAMPVNNNCKGQMSLMLHGTYTENGETKPTSYNLTIAPSGQVSGNAQDDDGSAQVSGTVVWQQGQPFGQIAWQEAGKIAVEAAGTLQEVVSPNGMFYAIEAQYVSNYQNTHGQTRVQSAPMAMASPAVVQGTVVGVPMQVQSNTEDNPNLTNKK